MTACIVENIALRHSIAAKSRRVLIVGDFQNPSMDVVPEFGNEVFDIEAIDGCATIETPVVANGRDTIQASEVYPPNSRYAHSFSEFATNVA